MLFVGSHALEVGEEHQRNSGNGHDHADHVHLANLDDGQEAGADPGVAGGQGAFGLGLQDDVADAAAHEHGSQGDNEGGDFQLGDEEADKHAEEHTHDHCRQHCHRGAHAEVHQQSTGHCAAGGDHGADAQVHVAGQYAQQHTYGQNDHVAVLHDKVVDIQGAEVLPAGDDGEDDVHGNQSQHHAVLLHAQTGFFLRALSSLFQCISHNYSPFLLWAMMQPMMASWVMALPTSSPAIAPSLMT